MRNGKSYKAAAAPARKSSPKGPWRSVNPARKAAWPQLGPETSAWRAGFTLRHGPWGLLLRAGAAAAL